MGPAARRALACRLLFPAPAQRQTLGVHIAGGNPVPRVEALVLFLFVLTKPLGAAPFPEPAREGELGRTVLRPPERWRSCAWPGDPQHLSGCFSMPHTEDRAQNAASRLAMLPAARDFQLLRGFLIDGLVHRQRSVLPRARCAHVGFFFKRGSDSEISEGSLQQ